MILNSGLQAPTSLYLPPSLSPLPNIMHSHTTNFLARVLLLCSHLQIADPSVNIYVLITDSCPGHLL